ncbi:hypothetical protein Snas_4410 [Stackebrandtia nassauensis DSM 44728]|uniref:Uncharacterized protein n=1 Tax=Stackebrandtia nassauensis (strain DSM 44728 / CIP 108903 / NRRL B-16338 / NBRC 102104 / LLR-40K-21) TaxID=446470 RepID=D3Q3Y9_STANL|nr:hypothetical protein Snas_4410 [Stackebrandtia nassauensis DSM 44728]
MFSRTDIREHIGLHLVKVDFLRMIHSSFRDSCLKNRKNERADSYGSCHPRRAGF